MKRILFLLLVGLTFQCISQTEVPIRLETVTGFKPGETTKQDIERVYGKPQKSGLSGEFTTSCYLHVKSLARQDVNLLFLRFDTNNVMVEKGLNDARAEAECGSLKSSLQRGGGNMGGSDFGRSGTGSGGGSNYCNMDIQCGVGSKCVSGVCTGGIGPQIRGSCVTGQFGKKVCSNSGKSCFNDSQCM